VTARPPKYALHKASGQARIRLNGRDHYLGPFGSHASLARYAQLVNDSVSDAPIAPATAPTKSNAPAATIARGYLFVECVVKYLKNASITWPTAEGGKNPELAHAERLLKLAADKFGDLAIDDLRGPHVKEIIELMISQGWSRGYVNHQLQRFRRFVRWCLSDDLCTAEVLTRVESVDCVKMGCPGVRETEPVKPVAESVFQKTLMYLPPVVADLLRIVALTGARPGEIRRLRIGDIDRSEGVWHARLRSHKTASRGKVRVLHFGPNAQKILAGYLDRPADEYVFSPKLSEQLRLRLLRERRKSPVQPSQVCRKKANASRTCGDYFKKASLSRAVARACEVAFGMPEKIRIVPKSLPANVRRQLLDEAKKWRAETVWNPAQIRHSRATEIRATYGIEAASAVLGHSGISITERYAEKNLAQAREIMAAIG
jgi:integrase